MKTKTLFWLIAVLTFLSVSCDKNSPTGNNSENDGEKPDEPLVELPELEDTDDVCTKMDDLNFMAYCYENFDVNGDSKVSMIEANAVTTIECNDATSFAGLEYFTNLKSFESSSVKTADFRYNKSLETIVCSKSGIESVDLRYNDKLTSIRFSDCELLVDVALPDNLTSIGEDTFSGCSSLTSIDIPDGVTSIGEYAFVNCSSLTSIDFPDWVKSIGSSAFRDCSSLVSIDIPDGVTSIEDHTFWGCSSLEAVDASQCDNLEYISEYAFRECPIKEFLLGTSNPPALSSFDNYMPDAVLKVPAESIEAYKNSDWADYFGTIEAL